MAAILPQVFAACSFPRAAGTSAADRAFAVMDPVDRLEPSGAGLGQYGGAGVGQFIGVGVLQASAAAFLALARLDFAIRSTGLADIFHGPAERRAVPVVR